jgi:hypothetical protein
VLRSLDRGVLDRLPERRRRAAISGLLAAIGLGVDEFVDLAIDAVTMLT